MLVFVDGAVYELQPSGGISRIFNEILPRMCDIDESLQIELLISAKPRQPLPIHSRIRHRTPPGYVRLYRLVRRFVGRAPRLRAVTKKPSGPVVSKSKFMAGSAWRCGPRGTVWHSTYYTMPPTGWQGPLVVTVPDMIPERLPGLFGGPNDDLLKENKRRSILVADTVICISEATKRDVQELHGIDSTKVSVVPLAHSSVFRVLDRPASLFTRPTDKLFFLYVGSRAHYKNFTGLIQAYAGWAGRKNVDLVVVGSPHSEAEKQSIHQLGLDSLCHFMTGIDDTALCDLYNQAAALVYPSLLEGFGIPLLEAMACGCPVVASRIPSSVEVAGHVPIYFELGKSADLVAALDLALSEGRNSMRVSQGLRLVKGYSWDNTARMTLQVYRDTVEKCQSILGPR